MELAKIKKIFRTQPSKNGAGFTLMEIMVATVIFAIVAVALLSLFNYVLKINRRGEALRQATQDSRDFVEFLVKEVRNGQIDYFVNSGSALYGPRINNDAPQAPCRPPLTPGSPVAVGDNPTYSTKSNWLGIINTDNVKECFYYAKADGVTYVDTIGSAPSKFDASNDGGSTLAMEKDNISTIQKLNPPNARIDNLMFIVRPQKDPYTKPAGGSVPKIQPTVVIIIKFVVLLPTGEQVSIYYQTAVSENKYDIPNQ